MLLLAPLAAGGCHVLFSSGPAPEPAKDARTPRPDHHLTATDQRAADGLACSEPQDINEQASACDLQCTSPAADQDCDGLPDAHDPQPNACNQLLVSEGFATRQSTTWKTSGTTSWSCGKLELAPGAAIELVDAALLKDAKYLVELRLTLGKPAPTPDDWMVRIATELGSPASFTCDLWVDHINGWSPDGGVHHNIQDSSFLCGGDAGMAASPQIPLDTSEGKTFTLQSYYTGAASGCRLAGENVSFTDPPLSYSCAQVSKGSIQVTTTRDVWLDQIRVFQIN